MFRNAIWSAINPLSVKGTIPFVILSDLKLESSDAKSAMSSLAPKGDQVEFGRLCDLDVAVLINPQDCQGEAAHGTKSGGQRSHDNDFQREAMQDTLPPGLIFAGR